MSDKFDGMTFVFTGTLSRFTRDEAEKMVTRLGGRASSLKEITLPESLEKIGGFAFTGCTALKEIQKEERRKQRKSEKERERILES